MKVRILSVDALHDGHGWSWDNWFTIQETEIPENITNRGIAKKLRDLGILTDYSKGKISIVDDGYNIEIREKSNQRPIVALCYGEFIN